MKKLSYGIIVASTFLIALTTSTIAPVSALASEVKEAANLNILLSKVSMHLESIMKENKKFQNHYIELKNAMEKKDREKLGNIMSELMDSNLHGISSRIGNLVLQLSEASLNDLREDGLTDEYLSLKKMKYDLMEVGMTAEDIMGLYEVIYSGSEVSQDFIDNNFKHRWDTIKEHARKIQDIIEKQLKNV